MKFSKKSVLAGLITSVILCLLSGLVLFNRYHYFKAIEGRALQDAAFSAKINVENCINRAMTEAKTLGFIVENYGMPDNFNSLAAGLLKNNSCVSAIELLDSGLITHVYPLGSNPNVIGYDVLKDPQREAEAMKARTLHRFYVAGPLPLRQGGIGIVGRMPLYRNAKFIGFSAIIIHFSDLLDAAHLHDSENNYFRYQIVKQMPNGRKMYFISGDRIFDEPGTASIEVPVAAWTIRVRPTDPLTVGKLSATIILGVLLAVIGGFFAAYMFNVPDKLKTLVNQRTALLLANEEMLRKTLRELQQKNSQLTRMTWTQSHEVRAPLARLLGLVNILKMSTELTGEDREIAGHIQASGEELDAMIRKAAQATAPEEPMGVKE